MNQHTIEGIEPRYYSRIPNMVTDDLNYAELALYVHYKRIASDNGKCWQSTAQISKKLGMTKPKLRKTRDNLESKGFIRITSRKTEDGVEYTSKVIQIVNVWEANVDRFSPSPENAPPLERKTTRGGAKRSTKKNQ